MTHRYIRDLTKLEDFELIKNQIETATKLTIHKLVFDVCYNVISNKCFKCESQNTCNDRTECKTYISIRDDLYKMFYDANPYEKETQYDTRCNNH